MSRSLALLASLVSLASPGRSESAPPPFPLPCAMQGFLENRGQWPEHVRFLARRGDVLVRVECGAIVLERLGQQCSEVTRLEFEGASGCAEFDGRERKPATYGFFLGNDPVRWHGGVPSFGSVVCHGLYGGVDLWLHESEQGLKYDLVLAPGVETSRVVLRCRGVLTTLSPENGALGLQGSLGSFLEVPGRSFEVLESGAEREVACTWEERSSGCFVLRAPDRDARFALVVDPELLWSTYLGGTGDDLPFATASDQDGDVYVSGETRGPTNFPLTPGTYLNPTPPQDLFLTKFRGSDGALLYSTVFGGSIVERPAAMACTAAGELTMVGYTQSADFPVTFGAFDTQKNTPAAAQVGFLLRFSPDGATLLFSTFIEGLQWSLSLKAIAVDAVGRSVVGGDAVSGDAPITLGAFQAVGSGTSDGYLARFDATGSTLEWGTFLGGNGSDTIHQISLAPNGTVVVSGVTLSHDFPTTPGCFKPSITNQTSQQVFVTRLNEDGGLLEWSSYLGGSGLQTDEVLGTDLGSDGSVYVAGTTTAANWPTTEGVVMKQFPGVQGATTGFLTRMKSGGAGLIWSTFLGDAQAGGASFVHVDRSGVLTLLSGGYPGSNFPTTLGAYDTVRDGIGPAVIRLSPKADRFFYSSWVETPTTDGIAGLSVKLPARATISGICHNPGLVPTTPNAFQPTFQGGQFDGFVTTLELYLQGIEPTTSSELSCLGEVIANATRMPQSGDTDFSVYASQAPPRALGWLAVVPAGAGHGSGGGVLLAQPSLLIPVRADPSGFVEKEVSLAATPAGTSFTCRFLFRPTPGCPATSGVVASNGLRITVQ